METSYFCSVLFNYYTNMTTKKNVITILFTFVALVGQAQIKVEVSETVELMSILARTAGNQEYNMDMAGQYTQDTETWFSPYKQHAAVLCFQELRDKHSISYDAVASMAIHLDIDGGKVKFLGETTDLDKRWTKVNIDDFIDKLNKFYKDTCFHEFFEQHRSFYNEGIKSYETEVMTHFHQDWYARFYGTEPTERFHVIIGFTNGGQNYGPSRHVSGQPREVFAICGYALSPTTGSPFWDAATLIHEFNHSFVNPLLDVDANAALIEKVGQKLFMLSQPEMERQAYNDWRIVVNESIVRAAVFIYIKDYNLINRGTGDFLFQEVWRKGFRWTPELVACLRNYTANREQYKTLADYYPEIARQLGKYVEDETQRMQNVLK